MEILALALPPQVGTIINILYVAIGLGLVIFIHELGHFAVAKWCGVKVERFSIGFGPVLWRMRRGETEYALSAIPFGGYVKMLGQDDADPSQMADERIARDPRSYTAKPVPQRIAIISAGVINNMISAVLFFVVAFMFGIKYQPAVIGHVTPGMPAWTAGLRLGDRITRIGDRSDSQLAFIDVQRAVALSAHNEVLDVEGIRDGKTFRTRLEPIVTKKTLFPIIAAEAEQGLTIAERDPGDKLGPFTPGLSAASAEPPLREGDRICEIDGTAVDNYAELKQALASKADQTVVLAVRRKAEPDSSPLTKISIAPNHFRTLGLRMAIGKIKAIQRGSPAEKDLRVGDTITHVVDDGAEKRVGVDIDPLRLPNLFAERAGQTVHLRVKREVAGSDPTTHDIELIPDNRGGWVDPPDPSPDCPLSIPAIGVAYHVLHHVVAIEPGGAAEKAGLLKDDNLAEIEFLPAPDSPADELSSKAFTITFDENHRNWPYAFWFMQTHPLRPVRLKVASQGASDTRTVELAPEQVADWYLPMRGFALQSLTKTRRAEDISEAVSLGFHHTKDALLDMFLTIRGLTSGRISPEALGGPIRIGGTAYHFTKQGLPDLILFLGMLSVNLAVLNFLPIPVLDGGHFVFLCWEGIRGKPPSERVVVTATYLGLALVLSLMAWVMYMDISGLLGGRN